MEFYKYQGTGNDFILIDDRQRSFREDPAFVAQLCDHHVGIGADGLLLLREREGYDFEMVYYNSDGSPATFCGNGGRCITAFARSLGILRPACRFLAADGEHHAIISEHEAGDYTIDLGMRDPVIYEIADDHIYLNSGTYHVVKFVADPDHVDLLAEARKTRYDQRYAPHGTNVNFVSVEGDTIRVRTYEKGVEDETLSCGTGVTAAAIAASLRNGGEHYRVITRGGELSVSFRRTKDSFSNVVLSGPAVRVFRGTLQTGQQ